jgi:hypothetical protein
MATVPRPLLALLALVVAFFAVWTLVLKPHAASDTVSAPQVVQRVSPAQPQAVGHATAPAAGSAADSHTATHKPATTAKPAAATPATGAHPGVRTAKDKAHAPRRTARPAFSEPATPQGRARALELALQANKVVALLFYNPAGSDDLADYHALTAIPADGGRVVRLAVPIGEIARYGVVTQQVAVTGSPTLVVIDSHHRAQTLVGFADQLEFNQRVAAALAAR